MSKKKVSKDNIKRSLNDGIEDISPFASIVLKEKKEAEKPKKKVVTPPKKPSEIVQGYNPNASFADILYSYEHSGNPFSMPKSSQKGVGGGKKTDFGAILDKWEGKSTKSVKSDARAKSEYKPTKSFGDILSRFEGVKEEEKKPAEKKATLAPPSSKEPYKRVSKEYKGTKDFSEILSSFEAPKKKEEIEIKEDKILEEKKDVEILSDNLFKKDSEWTRDPKASWSVLGGNESFVREVKKEEPPKEEKKEEASIPPKAQYKPTKSFSEILTSYENTVSKTCEEVVIKAEAKEEESTPNPLFKESDDYERAPNAAWSVLGGNSDFKREEAKNEKLPDLPEIKQAKHYTPTKEFSEILEEYKEEDVKTFDEILKEKGEESKKRALTINELRIMRPQATLDLHQMTKDEANSAVAEFLKECKENGIRKISIITGKGLHSEDGVGVLRSVAERVLDESGLVSEKKSAPLNAGGSGALWIILKA